PSRPRPRPRDVTRSPVRRGWTAGSTEYRERRHPWIRGPDSSPVPHPAPRPAVLGFVAENGRSGTPLRRTPLWTFPPLWPQISPLSRNHWTIPEQISHKP